MNENSFQHLTNGLTVMLERYLKLQVEITKARDRLAGREPETYDLYAIGGILHDVYHGAETICERIAREFDRKLPVGEHWHRLLLDQMANPYAGSRSSVLRSETATGLEEYRKFRHVFRNIYGIELNWPQMRPLLDNANPTIDAFAEDIEKFIVFLRMISDTDASN